MKRTTSLITFLTLILLFQAAWILFVLPAHESEKKYAITEQTPPSTDEQNKIQNFFTDVSSTFSFNYPLEWTVSTTSKITATTTEWFFDRENKGIADFNIHATELSLGSCAKSSIYRQIFHTNDPHTTVAALLCADGDNPSFGYIFWQKGLTFTKQSDIPKDAKDLSFLFITFFESGMNMDQAVGTVEQIASSVNVQ